MPSASLAKRGDQEPADSIERHDLVCRRCGSFAIEQPGRYGFVRGETFLLLSHFRFSCARYWRGPWSSHCWNCAACEHWFDPAKPGEQQLALPLE